MKQTHRAASMDRLKQLLRQVRPMTPRERAAQRVSFAFGNVRLENERVTKPHVSEAARRIPFERSK